jgi:hypothetical protein
MESEEGKFDEEYTEEMMQADMDAAIEAMIEVDRKQTEINQKEIEYVKAHIDYSPDIIDEALEDLTYFHHEGYIEVVKTDYKESGYSSYDFYVEKDNPKSRYYMRQDDDESGFHSMVWQTVGMLGDDYSGYMLYPLNNGKYWKIYYNC